jgi:hypothetical protein
MWGKSLTRAKRERLVARDPETIAEALYLLQGLPRTRVWYVLEGQSQPDACIETEDLLIVIEGKRTERETTTKTTWMPRRSQMLRLMDTAWEVRGNKRVLGLMIVEGCPEEDPYSPIDHWLKETQDQFCEAALSHSLPHRSATERAEIAAGFLGVATWQYVCRELKLPWPSHDDAD